MRALLVALLALLAGCSTPAPEPATPVTTPAATAPPAEAPTPHDLAEPGLPAVKRPFVDDGAHDLGYDDGYEVHERVVHGTRVVVPIHQSLGRAAEGATFAEEVFEAFDAHWHVFGGYAYDEYRIPLHGLDDDCAFRSATEVGFPVCASDYARVAGDPSRPPHPLVAGVDALVLHEMFHAWTGGTLRAVTRDVEGFTPEAWFVEGVTTYYAARGLATLDGMEAYAREMQQQAMTAHRAGRVAGGLSFEEAAARTPPPRSGPSPYVDYLYARGALVAYHLDAALAGHGKSLDDVMRDLYVAHGVPDAPFASEDVRDAAVRVGGEAMASFFERHVFGGDDLPPDVGYVDRDGLRVLPAPGIRPVGGLLVRGATGTVCAVEPGAQRPADCREAVDGVATFSLPEGAYDVGRARVVVRAGADAELTL